MNRLILIGNGFDLAHGFETRYTHFLNYVWENFNKGGIFDKIFKVNKEYFDTVEINNYSEFKKHFTHYTKHRYKFILKSGDRIFDINYVHENNSEELIFSVKNNLFEQLTLENLNNWVDIENHYYKILLELVSGNEYVNGILDIQQLNNEFNDIKDLLEHYITKEVDNKYKISHSTISSNTIISLFRYTYKNLKINKDDPYYNEFTDVNRKILEDLDEEFNVKFKSNSKVPLFENLFLDFNYTPTVEAYVNKLNKLSSLEFGFSDHIQIHGKLNNPDGDNPINFGFGDEMDDNYKIIEKKNDNNFLENIKSFMYLNNGNYKKLQNWVKSSPFQVIIMGHSCGLSDRTLLNTIFEDNNCKSIKIYFYDDEDYRTKVKNISRHFNKKTLMRDKIVNKSILYPLPQNVRFPVK